eukprot:SAG31_NODE_10575_length_1122_cov_1.156403_1_plen_161_part_10
MYQVATVFVDGQRQGHHVGGGLAFTVPVGKRVAAGESFALRVEVEGGALPPITPANQDGLMCRDRGQESCAGPPDHRNNCTWDSEIDDGFCAGVPAWPVGWYGQEQRWGIGDSVQLQARGAELAIIESFSRAGPIVDSRPTLLVNVTLRNEWPHTRAVQLQ